MEMKSLNGINYFSDEFQYYKMDDKDLDLLTKLQFELYDINDEPEYSTHSFQISLYKAKDLNELTNVYKSLAKDYLDEGHRVGGYYKPYKRLPYINIKGEIINKTIAEVIEDNYETELAIKFDDFVKQTFNTDDYIIYEVSMCDKYIEYCPFDTFYIINKSYVIFINEYALLLQYGTDV